MNAARRVSNEIKQIRGAFGLAFKALLLSSQIQQTEVCRVLGWPTTRMQRFLRGDGSMTVDELMLLSEHFGFDVGRALPGSPEIAAAPVLRDAIISDKAERDLIASYRILNTKGQRILRDVATMILESGNFPKKD